MTTVLVLCGLVAAIFALAIVFIRRSAMPKCYRCKGRYRTGMRTCPHCKVSLG